MPPSVSYTAFAAHEEAAMIVFGLLGGVVGLLAGEISRALATGRHAPGRPDLLSWILAASAALVMGFFQATEAEMTAALARLGLVALLFLVAASDIRERAVYPAIVYPGVVFAAAIGLLLGTPVTDAVLGAAVSVGVFAATYVVARVRYGTGAFGVGDVSVAALMGAVVGLSRLPLALALVGLAGGIIAIVAIVRTRSHRAAVPYAPALCAAALITPVLHSM
jgi:leader peptidase (prepilin peptidase)/N-methyltransferase